MKIERISENQIRCTLSREDLAERQIELGELAYGSEKARRLFHEMIETAAQEVGFEIENAPIMVEAVPLNMETIMLIVTRVDDPDELDTRFSRFSPAPEEDLPVQEEPQNILEGCGAENIDAKKSGEKSSQGVPSSSSHLPDAPPFRLFHFPSLDLVIQAAGAVKGMILVQSTLYKIEEGSYMLVIRKGNDEDSFHRICNTMSEYGSLKISKPSILAYLEEHCETIIVSRALDKLSKL